MSGGHSEEGKMRLIHTTEWMEWNDDEDYEDGEHGWTHEDDGTSCCLEGITDYQEVHGVELIPEELDHGDIEIRYSVSLTEFHGSMPGQARELMGWGKEALYGRSNALIVEASPLFWTLEWRKRDAEKV